MGRRQEGTSSGVHGAGLEVGGRGLEYRPPPPPTHGFPKRLGAVGFLRTQSRRVPEWGMERFLKVSTEEADGIPRVEV